MPARRLRLANVDFRPGCQRCPTRTGSAALPTFAGCFRRANPSSNHPIGCARTLYSSRGYAIGFILIAPRRARAQSDAMRLSADRSDDRVLRQRERRAATRTDPRPDVVARSQSCSSASASQSHSPGSVRRGDANPRAGRDRRNDACARGVKLRIVRDSRRRGLDHGLGGRREPATPARC